MITWRILYINCIFNENKVNELNSENDSNHAVANCQKSWKSFYLILSKFSVRFSDIFFLLFLVNRISKKMLWLRILEASECLFIFVRSGSQVIKNLSKWVIHCATLIGSRNFPITRPLFSLAQEKYDSFYNWL